MEKHVFEGFDDESYVKAVLPNGLEIYIMEKPQYSSCYAIYGTRYGSIDTRFAKNGEEMIDVPEGIAHYLEHKLFESEDGVLLLCEAEAIEDIAKIQEIIIS